MNGGEPVVRPGYRNRVFGLLNERDLSIGYLVDDWV
jgi:hypothetical protein